MNCPNCGAGLKIQNDKAVCEYCGYEEPLPGVKNSGNDDFFNMVVFNESPGGEDITLSVPEYNIGFIIRAGEAVAKDIPIGTHTIVVTCLGMTEYRSVFIPNDGRAVKIYVSRAAMGISVRVVEPGSENGTNSALRARQERTLPALALVMSILFPIVGFAVAIVDIANCRKQNRKPSTMTTIAIVISAVRLFLTLAFYAVYAVAQFR